MYLLEYELSCPQLALFVFLARQLILYVLVLSVTTLFKSAISVAYI